MLISRKSYLYWLGFLAVEMAVLPLLASAFGASLLGDAKELSWGMVFQLGLFVAGGLGILLLAAADFKKRRDADSLLLVMWVIATFVFATFLNWTANGRSVLPMAPAVAILIARNLKARPRLTGGMAACMLIPSAVLSVMVMWSDCSLANSARTAAREVHDTYGSGPVWFQGHWGFQYYMQALDAKPVNKARGGGRISGVLVLPVNNTNVTFPPSQLPPYDVIRVNCSGLPVIMSQSKGAGFYASLCGPLPYCFTSSIEEEYRIFLLK